MCRYLLRQAQTAHLCFPCTTKIKKNRFVVVHLDVEAVVTIWKILQTAMGLDILGWDMPEAFDASKVIKSISVVQGFWWRPCVFY